MTKIAPRKGYRLRRDILKTLGPLFAMLIDSNVTVDGKAVKFSDVISDPARLSVFLHEVMVHLIRTQPDEVFILMARVWKGTVRVEVPQVDDEGEDSGFETYEFDGNLAEVEDMFDEVFLDDTEMDVAFWEVLVFNFNPTFPVSFMNGGLASGKSKSTKSETSPPHPT